MSWIEPTLDPPTKVVRRVVMAMGEYKESRGREVKNQEAVGDPR
jgi:hypothetical protein